MQHFNSIWIIIQLGGSTYYVLPNNFDFICFRNKLFFQRFWLYQHYGKLLNFFIKICYYLSIIIQFANYLIDQLSTNHPRHIQCTYMLIYTSTTNLTKMQSPSASKSTKKNNKFHNSIVQRKLIPIKKKTTMKFAFEPLHHSTILLVNVKHTNQLFATKIVATNLRLNFNL